MLGRRPQAQQELWVASMDLVRGPGHALYEKLNALLAEAGFQVAARNLSVILRKLFGLGTPRGLNGLATLASLLQLAMSAFRVIHNCRNRTQPFLHRIVIDSSRSRAALQLAP